MEICNGKHRAALGKKIREGKDRLFPGRGGCSKFAHELGITPQLLSHWMNGNRVPDPGQLAALAKLFNISILELCSLPKIRGKGKQYSAYDIIAYMTKAQQTAGTSRKKRKMLMESNAAVKAFVNKELSGILL